jgi:phosphopantothenoylcysteine decarboxylase/phosphopantothenate--cysteine ligase
MGYALAAAAARRGARVTLVSGPVEIPPPANVERFDVVSAAEMAKAVHERVDGADLVLMSAAVSDQRPTVVAPQKVKKSPGEEGIVLERTEDILLTLGERFEGRTPRPLLVGFAAETEHVLAHAREKLVRKKVDAIVANRVGDNGAFGSADNEVTLVLPDRDVSLPRASKAEVADRLLDLVVPMLGKPMPGRMG